LGDNHDTTASSFVTKVRGEILAHFHVVAITVVCGIDCLACHYKLFVNKPLDVKEKNGHALDFAFHLSCLFWSW
jgi:hypothetical protein